MVCRAAPQTRFRALKHENGFAGNATIIVRVIACFQPLQDCRVLPPPSETRDVDLVSVHRLNNNKAVFFATSERSQSQEQHPIAAIFIGATLMGKDCEPWQFHSFNCASSVDAPSPAKQFTNSMVCPTYADPYGFFHLNSALMPPSNPTGIASGQKRFMVFDRSGDQTNLIYSSFGCQFLPPYPTNAGIELPASNETNIYNGNVNEEMHEDTEEIDALLYSDSENDYEEEEEASTGHSPVDMSVNFNDEEEEVASSAVLQSPPPPAKRRRVEPKLDPSLADAASSNQCSGGASSHEYSDRKKAKREKIQETVGVLRRIIPGGNGKDAAAVLDEAIRYLKLLRLKARGL